MPEVPQGPASCCPEREDERLQWGMLPTDVSKEGDGTTGPMPEGALEQLPRITTQPCQQRSNARQGAWWVAGVASSPPCNPRQSTLWPLRSGRNQYHPNKFSKKEKNTSNKCLKFFFLKRELKKLFLKREQITNYLLETWWGLQGKLKCNLTYRLQMRVCTRKWGFPKKKIHS